MFKVSYGAELGRSADVFWVLKGLHNIAMCFPDKCFVVKSAERTRTADLLDQELVGVLFLLHQEVLCFPRVSWRRSHCGEPALALLRRPPRFARDLCVPTLVSCWSVQWPRSHSVPRRGVLVRHCSVSTTKSPTCVAQRASCLQMLIVVFRSIQWRQRQRVQQSSRRSPRLDLGTNARYMACGASVVRHVPGV